MKRSASAILALSLALAAVVGGAAVPALADDTPPVSLAAIQTAANLRITQRVADLDKATIRVNAHSYLSPSNKETILATLSADVSGLEALGATIAADTDRATAAAHFTQIFTDYRVYAVAIPQSSYAAAADALTASALPALVAAHDGLVTALAVSGRSTPELEQTLVDMQAEIDEAAAVISGVAASALAVTPDDFNSNSAVLADERAAVSTATAAARQARVYGNTVLEALR